METAVFYAKESLHIVHECVDVDRWFLALSTDFFVELGAGYDGTLQRKISHGISSLTWTIRENAQAQARTSFECP